MSCGAETRSIGGGIQKIDSTPQEYIFYRTKATI
jgi:hypothetical protein